MPTSTRIGAVEAAQRLGVKIETLYAYVSRGFLRSEHAPGRQSTFDLDEVEALRATGRRQAQQHARPFKFPALTTRLTSVGRGQLIYRGHDALELARLHTFEQVAGLLWKGHLDRAQVMKVSRSTRQSTSRLLAAAPPSADQASRIRLAVTAAAAADSRRLDLRPAAVARAGSSAIACMLLAADTHGRAQADTDRDASLEGEKVESTTDRLWRAVASTDADDSLRRCLEAALILLADHGLAASTVAARAAASARAHPYAVVSAGLATLEGPFHGAADATAHRLLVDAYTRPSGTRLADVVARHRRADGSIPGLSEPPSDPRASTLLDILRESGSAGHVLAELAKIHEMIDPDHELVPNVELALGALTVAAGMTDEAAYLITSVARAVGWVAHAIEEYDEPPLRWRAREIYTGPAAPSS